MWPSKNDAAILLMNNKTVVFKRFRRFPTDRFTHKPLDNDVSKEFVVKAEDVIQSEKNVHKRYLLYLPNQVAPFHFTNDATMDQLKYNQNAINMLDQDHTVRELTKVKESHSLMFLLFLVLGLVVGIVIMSMVILTEPKVFHLQPIVNSTKASIVNLITVLRGN